MSTTNERLYIAKDALAQAGSSDLTPEEVVEITEHVDAGLRRVSHALTGLSIMEAQLVLGGLLRATIEVGTEDELEILKIAMASMKHGRVYISADIDLAAWKAAVLATEGSSRPEVSRETPSE